MYLLSSYYVPGILCMRKQQKTREKKKKIPASKLYSIREEIDTLNKKKKKTIYSIQPVAFERSTLGYLVAPQV